MHFVNLNAKDFCMLLYFGLTGFFGFFWLVKKTKKKQSMPVYNTWLLYMRTIISDNTTFYLFKNILFSYSLSFLRIQCTAFNYASGRIWQQETHLYKGKSFLHLFKLWNIIISRLYFGMAGLFRTRK